MKQKKIAVVLGGPSKEREVSLKTGEAIYQALLSKNYNVVKLDLQPDNFASQLRENHIDVVFNAVHGLYGEDGSMQGLLDMLGIKYTGSGVLASALAMDKIMSKRIFIAENILTPEFLIVRKKDIDTSCKEIMKKFSLPVVVKPPAQGSSIGVEVVKTEQELNVALIGAFGYAEEVLIEEFIEGREITVGIAAVDEDLRALPIVEIVPNSGVYDYHSKYTVGATKYIVPAQIVLELTVQIQNIAKHAFAALGCSGVARADFILTKAGKAYILELNTTPGMTATSLVPKAAKAIGIEFAELCEKILLSIK